MTVRELAKWLRSLPPVMQDAEVEVVVEGKETPFIPGESLEWPAINGTWEFRDFTTNRFVKDDPEHPAFGKKILILGEE